MVGWTILEDTLLLRLRPKDKYIRSCLTFTEVASGSTKLEETQLAVFVFLLDFQDKNTVAFDAFN